MLQRGIKLSYSNTQAVLKSFLLQIGFDLKFVAKFGLHSFLVGATMAAHASGELINMEIQASGRWNSSETPKTYNLATEVEMCKFSKVIAKGLF